ncbi:epoxide hydrolase N-terminal domain-containing protein [Solwaraspora sp. WMMD791]|uniref:epoxide hydrolase N-terminal domain-containing protein n=1 Tax=Solwaraspora sp. WMMD791 TaxID=3016086 RepID=UPI0032B35C01
MAADAVFRRRRAIRPYRIDVPQAGIDDLSRRLAETHWPAALGDDGWDCGVPVSYLRELAGWRPARIFATSC